MVESIRVKITVSDIKEICKCIPKKTYLCDCVLVYTFKRGFRGLGFVLLGGFRFKHCKGFEKKFLRHRHLCEVMSLAEIAEIEAINCYKRLCHAANLIQERVIVQ